MILLAVLLGFAIDRFWHGVEGMRTFVWWRRYSTWLDFKLGGRTFWDGPWGVVAALAPPVGAMALLQHLLTGWLGLFGFVLAVVVLVLCLGPRDLETQVQGMIGAWERGDHVLACDRAAEFLDGAPPATYVELASQVTARVFMEASGRIVAVAFWFVVLGPTGALLFRLCSLLRRRLEQAPGSWAYGEAVERLYGVLSWAPARLTALGYAVTGNFVDAMQGWRTAAMQAQSWWAGHQEILMAAGRGALSLERMPILDDDGGDAAASQVQAALALVWRTIIFWLIVLALLTLAYWAA